MPPTLHRTFAIPVVLGGTLLDAMLLPVVLPSCLAAVSLRSGECHCPNNLGSLRRRAHWQAPHQGHIRALRRRLDDEELLARLSDVAVAERKPPGFD